MKFSCRRPLRTPHYRPVGALTSVLASGAHKLAEAKHRGFAFVTYGSAADAQDAIDLPPEPKKPVNRKHRGPPVSEAVQASRKLQSAFVKLPENFLDQTRVLAATLPLTRPIPRQTRLFPSKSFDAESILTCPQRPKWRFDMSKIEVEKNEEGLFRKWLDQTDDAVEKWQRLSHNGGYVRGSSQDCAYSD